MIGNEAFPGIAPRSFKEIFDLLESNVKKFSFSVTLYMCELYNDMLIDLLDKGNDKKLDIKKDKKGEFYISELLYYSFTQFRKLLVSFFLCVLILWLWLLFIINSYPLWLVADLLENIDGSIII